MNVNLSSIIANRPALYRKFTLKIGPHLSDEQFDFLESENTRGVSQISFVGFLPEYTPRMNSIVDRILDKYGSGIKIVSFGRYRSNRARQFFTWQYLYKILKKTENVEELVFEACEFSNDNVYDNFGDLEKIHLKCLRYVLTAELDFN